MQLNNKKISAYSPEALLSVRPMLRRGLLHNDVSDELQVLLDQYGHEMVLAVKNRTLMSCSWDPEYKLERQWFLFDT